MRTLIHIPIIHSGADMGSMADELSKKGVSEFGRDFWQKHVQRVNTYWDIIKLCCDKVKLVPGTVKIYQDGMVAEGELAIKIISESARAGSRNYEIVSDLILKGAVIVQTEDLNLVKKEVEMLRSLPSSGPAILKLARIIVLKIKRSKLLNQRDAYIAARIDSTLGPGETGILFLGAYHSISGKLPEDIRVVEFKDIRKVKEYQRILPFHARKKEEFEALSNYLVTPEDNFSYPLPE